MKKLLASAILAASLTTSFATPAAAYDRPAIALGLGSYHVFDNSILGADAEYRFASLRSVPNLSPMAGFELDSKGALYAYAGALYDWNFYDKFFLVPSFGIGAYNKGDSKDLGGTLEFRSSIEANYSITPDARFGVALSHKSNAGIYSRNPGTEELLAVYSFQY